MANFHKNSIPYILYNNYDTDNDIILEIGSERGEGSTAFFDHYASQFEIPFYSVDVSDFAKNNLTHLKNTNFVIDTGSSWTSKILPILNKKIKILYLDNYDWTNPGMEQERIKDLYLENNIVWSNMGSQVEHLSQMINCIPYMSDQSIVICDDTPIVDHHQTYTGKCGAVIPYLLINKYEIVYSCNNGVILIRNI